MSYKLNSDQIERLSKYYDWLDTDGDGELTLHDFDAAIERMVKALGLTSEQAKEYKESYYDVLKMVYSGFAAGEDVKVTKALFLEYIEKAIAKDKEAYKKSIRDRAAVMFKHYDLDKSGFIDMKEFSAFLLTSDDEAEKVFKHFDTDNNGQLSLEEFQQFWEDFYLGDSKILNVNYFSTCFHLFFHLLNLLFLLFNFFPLFLLYGSVCCPYC